MENYSCNDCRVERKCTFVGNAEEEPYMGKNIFRLPLRCPGFITPPVWPPKMRVWWDKDIASKMMRMRSTLSAGPNQTV